MNINERSLSNFKTYRALGPKFKSFADLFRENIPRSFGITSAFSYLEHGCTFLLHLEQCKIRDLDEVTHEAVVSFFIDPDGNKIRGAEYKQHVSRFLEIISEKIPSANKVRALLPKILRKRKLRQAFTLEESKALRQILTAEPPVLSAFDKAVGCLLYYTGLRRSDVALMKAGNISWERDEIVIVQKKDW